jgi:UTP--glucose-1-phosphate uridylyltransferase
MSVNTAVIPVAGVGTRVFPITTAIEKFMMPIYAGEYSRPIIDYMVRDCAKADIKRIIFVTTARGKKQLQDYFEDIDSNLEAQLQGLGKKDRLNEEKERRRLNGLTYEYIIQPLGKYGTAYPLYLARKYLNGEKQFALMGGDDFVYREDGSSELLEAINLWEKTKTDHVIMGNPVSREEATKYGVLQIDNQGRLVSIDEKPPIERISPSPVVNISWYLFSESIWSYIEDEIAKNRGTGEHYITYPINSVLDTGQTFQVHPVGGVYMDGGSFEGLLKASLYISEHPQSGIMS